MSRITIIAAVLFSAGLILMNAGPAYAPSIIDNSSTALAPIEDPSIIDKSSAALAQGQIKAGVLSGNKAMVKAKAAGASVAASKTAGINACRAAGGGAKVCACAAKTGFSSRVFDSTGGFTAC